MFENVAQDIENVRSDFGDTGKTWASYAQGSIRKFDAEFQRIPDNLKDAFFGSMAQDSATLQQAWKNGYDTGLREGIQLTSSQKAGYILIGVGATALIGAAVFGIRKLYECVKSPAEQVSAPKEVEQTSENEEN